MELTGKASKDFDKWFLEYANTMRWSSWSEFYNNSNNAMRFGVYVDFFNFKGFELSITPEYYFYEYLISWSDSDFAQGTTITKNRDKARELTILTADEIYNRL